MIDLKNWESDGELHSSEQEENNSAAHSTADAESLLADADAALRANDYRSALDIYKFLATMGDPRGEREFALMLEKGQLLPRDIPMAERYFFSAAKKGDPTAAYRYSRLVSRLNQEAGEFWLELAALMECTDAYADAVRMYDQRADAETAAYYSCLLAREGDPDAIVDMARRHLYGNGVKQNERYSKWYMNRLKRTPIYAVSLSHKLHSVGAENAPPMVEFTQKNTILRSLISRAKQYGYRNLLLILADLFAKSDAKDAAVDLAYLYIEGVEFEQNIELGLELLTRAESEGSAAGAKYLGDLYSEGKYVEKDTLTALKYYRRSAELGCDGAFEAIGDVFYKGEITTSEPLLALRLYERGAAAGSRGCAAKARRIRDERESNYNLALKAEKSSKDEAFKLLLSSVSAGYTPAHAKIAEYYEQGIGTEVNRREAFRHYRAAVDAKDVRALEGLGRCYAYGIGTNFDFDKAAKYLSAAKDAGSATADGELLRIYENKKRHMLRSLYSTTMRVYYQGKFTEAKELIKTCISLGIAEAVYCVGCMYEFGITLPPNRELAMKYYKSAAEMGYKDDRGAHKQWLLRISKKYKI